MNLILPPGCQAILERSGAMETRHTGRTLFDHLGRTYALLKAWGNPLATCLGGLFHSIYGTNAFLHQSLAASQRAELAAVIGEPAETLAWLFCNMDRPRAILDGVRETHKPPTLALRRRSQPPHLTESSTALLCTADQLRALAEIECANLIEQGHWGRSLKALYCAAIDQPGLLSDSAIAALRAGLSHRLAADERVEA